MRAAAYGALSLILVALVVGDAAGPAAPAGTDAPSASIGRASPSASSSAWATTATTSPGPDATPTGTAGPSGSPRTEWQLDLYDPAGMRFQNPDLYACTATSVQITLNLIALARGDTYWSPTISYVAQEEILSYERAHMTLPTQFIGSDPHGTRNALNHFGWGSIQAGVYVDTAFTTFGAAAKSIVKSVARTHKPAIIFTLLGGHSQVVTGYKAHGKDPATSDDFTVEGVYLTDPLNGYVYIVYKGVSRKLVAITPDTYVALANWQYGEDAVRYGRYEQADSTLRDPIDGLIGRREWYDKWVVVLAIA